MFEIVSMNNLKSFVLFFILRTQCKKYKALHPRL